jgi:hypothetical protein
MALRGRATPVFQNIQFKDCTRRDVAGPTTEAVVAAVLGEYCKPGAPPMRARSLFDGAARVLGEDGFRQVWAEFLKQAVGRKANPLDFADFLARHEHGRALPPLADLARFDLAYALAAQPGPAPSVAACCLTEATIRLHRGLMLRFQPNWRYVELTWPVHRLPPETLTADLLKTFSPAEPVYLRIAPTGQGVGITELSAADFALQRALRDGRRLGDAMAAAHAADPSLDPFPIVAGLVEAGAIMDMVLHPAEPPDLQPSRP